MAKKRTFETALKELEQIVMDLETGDSSLEKALKKFEDGVGLAKFCSEKLEEIEKKVTVLMEDQEIKPADGASANVPPESDP